MSFITKFNIFPGHGRFKSERKKTDLEQERRIREQQVRKIRREEREKEREQRRDKDKERQKARLKEREVRRNERLKERAKEENKVERKRREQTKWRPVSKEIDWKKESMEKKKEINRRVGAPTSERSGRSEVKDRPARRHDESDSSDEDMTKPKIPSLMSIIAKDTKRGSGSRDTTPVERTKYDGKNTAELLSESRKRKLQQTEEEDAKRKPNARDKLEQKLKERKQQKQLPPPPPPRSKETKENPEELSSLKKIEQRLKERREKSRKEPDPRTLAGRKEMADGARLKRKQVKGKYIFLYISFGQS